jgi:hypothetical protein
MNSETEPEPHKKDVDGRSFTDVFIKHPVLAVVVNLLIVLVGWRAIMTLPVQQWSYPGLWRSRSRRS